jgi:hypothetical protein
MEAEEKMLVEESSPRRHKGPPKGESAFSEISPGGGVSPRADTKKSIFPGTADSTDIFNMDLCYRLA